MASAYTKNLIKTFLQQHYQDIKNGIVDTGLFFPAVVAQLSVESENGTSDLAALYNNYGGIKGDSSNGVLLDTTEGNKRTPQKAWFRKFDNFSDFMDYYVSNLKQPRYIDAGVFDATSPEDQITKMVQAGYSTMSPKAYLASGVQDRINATRDLMPFGLIVSNPDPNYNVNNLGMPYQVIPN